jgi:7-cyano-7-deazaguanine synthase in queuosine biosynthesis
MRMAPVVELFDYCVAVRGIRPSEFSTLINACLLAIAHRLGHTTEDPQVLALAALMDTSDYVEYASCRPSAIVRAIDAMFVSKDAKLDLFLLRASLMNSGTYGFNPLLILFKITLDY